MANDQSFFDDAYPSSAASVNSDKSTKSNTATIPHSQPPARVANMSGTATASKSPAQTARAPGLGPSQRTDRAIQVIDLDAPQTLQGAGGSNLDDMDCVEITSVKRVKALPAPKTTLKGSASYIRASAPSPSPSRGSISAPAANTNRIVALPKSGTTMGNTYTQPALKRSATYGQPVAPKKIKTEGNQMPQDLASNCQLPPPHHHAEGSRQSLYHGPSAFAPSAFGTSANAPNPPVTSSSTGPALDLITHWKPENWTLSHYTTMSSLIGRHFPVAEFASIFKIDHQEVYDVLSGAFQMPFLDQAPPSDLAASAHDGGEGETRMRRFERLQAELRVLQARDRVKMREELMDEAKAVVLAQLSREGWVKIEKAKDLISEHEKTVKEEGFNVDSGQEGGKGAAAGKARQKVLSIEEATDNLMAANEDFSKAKKANERKNKSARKREEKDGEKKGGRPKKGGGKEMGFEGKGKGCGM